MSPVTSVTYVAGLYSFHPSPVTLHTSLSSTSFQRLLYVLRLIYSSHSKSRLGAGFEHSLPLPTFIPAPNAIFRSLIGKAQMISFRHSAVILLATSLASCGQDSPTGTDLPLECSGPLAVTVSGGLQPSFAWEPKCGMSWILIEATQRGTEGDRWVIHSPTNIIMPPVTFGTLPAGVSQYNPAQPLTAGVEYRIALARVLDSGADAGKEKITTIVTFRP